MRRSLLTAAVLALTIPITSLPAVAEEKAVVDAMESYMDFVDYGGATIFPEKIPKDDWKKFFVVDGYKMVELLSISYMAFSSSNLPLRG